ncbi:MAG: fimbrillin family protein, partial [Prevotellaceae bacterium]|nr:fimbrillin family protein [Prevotellaceae bacterium]
MKKTIYSLLAAMLLAGCNNIEENTNNGKEPGSDFDVTACKIASTRVGYGVTEDNLTAAWEESDQISIYANAVAGATPNRGTLRFVEYKSTDKTQANFKGHFDTDVKTATTVYAYAQYPNVYNQADAIVNDLHYQSGEITGEGSATTHDILFATGEYDPESTAPLNLTFTRKMAIVKFEITLPESVTATIPQAVSVTGG